MLIGRGRASVMLVLLFISACVVCVCLVGVRSGRLSFFFFNDTATTEIYTLSLHDALPICPLGSEFQLPDL